MSKVSDLYLRYQQLVHEGFKFGVVGLVGVVITDGGTNLLVARHLDWLLANAIATFIAIAVTYVGSRYWTFRSRAGSGGLSSETIPFFGLALVGLGIQLGFLGFAVHVLGETKGLVPNIFLLMGIVVATAFRFLSYRKWVFKEPLTEALAEEHEALAAETATVASSAPGGGGVRGDQRGRI